MKRTRKRKAVTVALAEFPNLSDRQIAELCGVHHELVGKIRKQVENSSTSLTRRIGAEGKSYPATKPATMRHEPRGKPKAVTWSPGSATKVRMKPQAAKLWRRLEKLGKARRARLCQS